MIRVKSSKACWISWVTQKLSLLIFLGGVPYAQGHAAWKVEPYVGGNFARIMRNESYVELCNNHGLERTLGTWGLQLGTGLGYSVSPFLELWTGLGYRSTGIHLKRAADGASVSKLKLHYMGLPVQARIFLSGKGRGAFLQGGLQIGVKLHHSLPSVDHYRRIPSAFRRWDFGMNYCAGCSFLNKGVVQLLVYHSFIPSSPEEFGYQPARPGSALRNFPLAYNFSIALRVGLDVTRYFHLKHTGK